MSHPLSREIYNNERGEEIIDLAGPGAGQNTSHGRDDKQNRNHSEEAVESIHEVSTSTSHDEHEIASSVDNVDLRDVESSISEPPFTVFTSSQKRFIALLAACAGFFSAVGLSAQCSRNSSLTLLGFGKHIFSSSQFTD
jgi:hypothetical protein